MKKVLFVCTGNTCRSSMAEGLFNYAVENMADGSYKGFRAFSAGISAFDQDCANPNAVKVLKDEYGIDISSHRARRITKSDVESAHIIFTMTRDHKDAVIGMFPEAKDKTYTLKEFVLENNISKESMEYNFALDIPDPYGMPEGVYKRCAREINDVVEKLILKLKTV